MSYFAAALARNDKGWTARELDLDDAETIDDVVDLVREIDESADTTLLFVEEDDVYVGIVRVDGPDAEPRVFLSAASAAAEYDLAGLLSDGVEDATEDDDEDEPVGDAALLGDLGTSARELLRLVRHEGTLPSDVITSACEKAGCIDELESLRGT